MCYMYIKCPHCPGAYIPYESVEDTCWGLELIQYQSLFNPLAMSMH